MTAIRTVFVVGFAIAGPRILGLIDSTSSIGESAMWGAVFGAAGGLVGAVVGKLVEPKTDRRQRAV